MCAILYLQMIKVKENTTTNFAMDCKIERIEWTAILYFSESARQLFANKDIIIAMTLDIEQIKQNKGKKKRVFFLSSFDIGQETITKIKPVSSHSLKINKDLANPTLT